MTIPDAPVTYAVTRIALIDALGNVPLTRDAHLAARGKMADKLLDGMPVLPVPCPAPEDAQEAAARAFDASLASEGMRPDGPSLRALRAAVEAAAGDLTGAQLYMEGVKAERERIRQAAQERFDALGEGDFSQAAQAVADILLIVSEPQP